MSLLAMATLGFVSLSMVAQAQPSAAGLPSYQDGQAFVFDNGRIEQVSAMRSDRIVWAARSGRTYERSRNPVTPILSWSYRGQSGSRKIVGDADKLWPLRPGKQVQFQSINETRTEKGRVVRSVHLWRCNVRAAQVVRTPAGAFEAVPIQCDRFSVNSMKVLERLTWYYSNDVGHYVRREARDMRSGVAETYALFAAVPGWEANPLRLESLAKAAEKGSKPS
jgi:hypothetical protein